MRAFAIATLLLLPLGAAAQTDKIPKEVESTLKATKKNLSLEEMLRESLKRNPDVRLAEARLKEAEAVLNKVRLETLQKVVMAHHHIEQAKAAASETKQRVERLKRLYASKAVSVEEFNLGMFQLQKALADLARAEAELPILIGRPPMEAVGKDFSGIGMPSLGVEVSSYGFTFSKPISFTDSKSAAPSAVNAKKLREFLNTPVKFDFESVPPRDVFDYIRKLDPKVNLHVPDVFPIASVTLSLKEPVPVAAVFQWFEDNAGVRFVIREYGIVVAAQENVPPGAMLVLDFWRGRDEPEVPGK